MRIRNFTTFLDRIALDSDFNLYDSSLVIDGHNFLYHKYNEANLPYIFGCECDRFAYFLTQKLKKFQKANVKCYFVFKGANEYNHKLLNLDPLEETEVTLKDKYYEPLFDREVYKQVLDEMDFDYAICESVCKRECVALAQKLSCPVLALDAEYFFFGVNYIPFTSLNYDSCDNILQCKLYNLDMLKQMFQLDDKQIAIFTTLFDEKTFPKSFLDDLLSKLRLPLSYKDSKRHSVFLMWLQKHNKDSLKIITKFVTRPEYLKMQSEIERKGKKMINIQESGGLPTQYLINRNICHINKSDPDWFAKGVIRKLIPIPYINIWKWKIVEGSWCIEDKDAEDSLLLSAPIIKYAFDLLTNFQNEELLYKGKKRTQQMAESENEPANTDTVLRIQRPVRKPDYGSGNVFENGWDNIRSYRLFEHFLSETLNMSDLDRLEKAPSDARLLLISLVYFSSRKNTEVRNEAYAILLSFIMLGVVSNITNRESTTYKNAPTASDCKLARNLMDEYFKISEEELTHILDRKILHPLVEFQHCLRHINFLNTLCGSPFAPTVYSKTYNATLVYKILYCIVQNFQGNGSKFLEEKLKGAATVLSFLSSIIDLYNEIK